MRKVFLLFALVLTVAFTSCNSSNNIRTIQHNNVAILSQGNYTEQNASVYLYDEDSKEMTPFAFQNANGHAIGATLMSASFNSAGIGYLLCSNPDKIEIVDITTMKSIVKDALTDGLSNTREILAVGAYFFVTNAGTEYEVAEDGSYVYTNSYVAVYNAANNSLVKKIEVGSDAHGMTFYATSSTEGVLFVGTRDGVVSINCTHGEFNKEPEIITDSQYTGNVRYLCNVNNTIYASVPGYGIFAFDPVTRGTLWRSDVPLDFNGYITADRENIYTYATLYNSDWSIASSNIYKLSLSTKDYSEIASGDYLYSVGVSSATGNIFYSEANDFITNSTMMVLARSGNSIVDTKTTGVGTFRYLFFTYFTEEEKEADPAV